MKEREKKRKILLAQGRARVAGAVETGTELFGAAIIAPRRSSSSSFNLFQSSSLSFSRFFSLQFCHFFFFVLSFFFNTNN